MAIAKLKLRIEIVLAAILATALQLDSFLAAAEKSKLWLAPGVEPLQVSNTGPFVALDNGSLVGVRGAQALVSRDEGQTWQKHPLSTAAKIDASIEQGIVLTRAGTIVLGCLNNAANVKWGWNAERNEPIEGIRLPVWTARSTDGGKTWTDVQEVQGGYSGGVRQIIQLKSGRLVMPAQHMAYPQPYSTSSAFVSDDDGRTWRQSNTIDIGGRGHHDGGIEGTVFEHRDNTLQMLLRTPRHKFWQAFSRDGGLTWTDIGESQIAASSSPGIVERLESGRLALVWNQVYPEGRSSYPLFNKQGFQDRPSSWQREEVSIAFSQDDGKTWTKPKVIAKQPKTHFCNPNLFERRPGELWITTQFGGLAVRLREADFVSSPVPNSERPPTATSTSIVDVNRKLYRKQEHPEFPTWVKMYSTGPTGQRWEVVADESSGSDVWENIRSRVSSDNGRTWSPFEKLPNNVQVYNGVDVWEGDDLSLPLYDPKSGVLVQTWLRQIQEKRKPHRNFTYYRLSRDHGRTWSTPKQFKYEPGPDFDPRNPLNPDFLNKNNAYLPPNIERLASGDLVLCTGNVPNPQGGPKGVKGEEMGAVCFIGKWDAAKDDYDWTAGKPVFITPQVSSRGLLETNVAQLRDGRLLIVWRGSNAGIKDPTAADVAGRKLFSLSSDGGKTLSPVAEWKYDDGSRFYSPSSFHRLFRHQASGKLYWIGNICPDRPTGNHPRFPLVIAEVDEDKAALKKNTVTMIADRPAGATDRFQLSNFSLLENPEDHTIELLMADYDGGFDGIPRRGDCYKYTLTFR